jgi:phosphate transport system protein
MLEEKLVALKKELIEFSSLVEVMVEKSINGVSRKNRELLEEVLNNDEPIANNYDITLDEHCTNIIAQYQPRAKSLRVVLMALKMSGDLERMGDHAVNIVESGLFLIERPAVKPLIDIPKMGELTINMLKDSLTAFVNEDAPLAKSVCERDNQVDELKHHILNELTEIMSNDPSTVERALHLIRITGNLERIADLSTNVCEDVLYMVDGRVIKHHLEEKSLPPQ